MSRFSEVWFRVRSLVRRETLEAELDEEMRLHRELLEDDARRRGVPAEEARRLAAVRFGNATVARERSREWWSFGWAEDAVRDIRYGARFLRRSPVFTLVAMMSIGLGVGANAAVFTLVDRVFFRPPAGLPDAGLLRRVYLRTEGDGRPAYVRGVMAWEEYFAIDSLSRLFASITGYDVEPAKLGEGLDAPVVERSLATWRYFNTLGIRPAAGRLFVADDDRDGAPPVAVLSHGFWQRQFGGSRDAVGQVLALGGQRVTVIGVAQPGFAGLEPKAADLWMTPAGVHSQGGRTRWRSGRNSMGTQVIVRLAPGVSEEQAAAEVARVIQNLPSTAEQWENQTFTAEVGALIRARGPEQHRGGIAVTTRLGIAAILVLLAGCANLGNLLLARGLVRRRELAVRLAIGIRRRRLVAQLLTEALLICGGGVLLALLMAQWGGLVLRALVMPDTSWSSPVDGRIVLFTVLAALAFGILAALTPAWRASRTDVAQALKAGGRAQGSSGQGLRNTLLVSQLAFSVALLVGAGLFTRSLLRAARFDVGFDAKSTLGVGIDVLGSRSSRALRELIAAEAGERIRTVPGVREVALTHSVPFASLSFDRLTIPERDITEALRAHHIFMVPTTGAAMRTLGVRLVRGRLLDDMDTRGAPRVVVVSERLARLLWPGDDAIGKRLRVGDDSIPYSEVVGVTRDLVTYRLTEAEEAQYWVPAAQIGWEASDLVVRIEGDVDDAAVRIRAALTGWRSDLAALGVTPIRHRLDEQMRPWRLGASVFAGFGAIALVLAAMGVFGIVSFAVTQRTPEFGIRAALGASRARLAAMVLNDTLRLAVVGLAAGVLIALVASRWLEGLLFDTSGRDLVSIAAAAVLLLIAALLAALAPTRRATKVDPVMALRSE